MRAACPPLAGARPARLRWLGNRGGGGGGGGGVAASGSVARPRAARLLRPVARPAPWRAYSVQPADGVAAAEPLFKGGDGELPLADPAAGLDARGGKPGPDAAAIAAATAAGAADSSDESDAGSDATAIAAALGSSSSSSNDDDGGSSGAPGPPSSVGSEAAGGGADCEAEDGAADEGAAEGPWWQGEDEGEGAEGEEEGEWEVVEEGEGEGEGEEQAVGAAAPAAGDDGGPGPSSTALASALALERARGIGADGAVLDIARDAALALRLMGVLDPTGGARQPGGGGDGPGSSGGGGDGGGGAGGSWAGAEAAAAGQQGQGQAQGPSPDVVADVVIGEARARMRARPPGFCLNCCSPLERMTGSGDAACGVCGHSAADDAALLPPRPDGGWGSATAGTRDPARAEAAEAVWNAAALARASGLPAWPAARVLLAWHEDSLLHRAMLPPYPERPERLSAILARLQASGLLEVCEAMPVLEASDEALLSVHSAALVGAIDALSPGTAFPEQLDGAGLSAASPPLAPESLGNRHTARAARLAAGAAAGLAERLARGEADAGFALVRPAGHLASEGSAEGGALYNNVAVAARAAQRAGAGRVLILDWDAHAAKGTASIFEDDASVVVVSMHKAGSWFYPGGCPLSQVGRGPAAGTTVNIAWTAPARAGGRRGGGAESMALEDVQPGGGDYLAAVSSIVAPIVREWGPDVILVSAGFDSAEGDPVGLGSVPPPVFAHMTAMLRALGPPVGMVLEGGYVLKQTSACVELCVRALMGERPPPLSALGTCTPTTVGWNTIARTLAVHQHFWSSLGTLSLANALAGGAGAAPSPGGAADLAALIAAAQGEAASARGGEGAEEGEQEEEWEVEEDGEWEEDDGEGEDEGSLAVAEVEVGPGEWAGETAA
ncbi:histone deacetylase [Raphidocelis subcapitata]|uniref:Histone deacetylase n=1 Tax=Raphidocelis subcapitata TaxID=307507 RepID=A0A2V0PE58_9CHLO|nr:histone deacetylase [Raphidocelis subcapitata]|eukprot:GBF98141.1 histone deacetylase [Raphidocelis subcapitata]